MRADRLLSILLLLQARGPMTAQDLAVELEVSSRTIYRDINALSVAGVPVYGESGHGGGYALLESYRTNLTGLTEGEVRALFMLHVPAALSDLGMVNELRAAMVKLSAALPDQRRRDEEKIRQCFHLDSKGWRRDEEPVPHLRAVHQAVWENRKLHITYRPLFANVIERLVAPYGLVAKAGAWYLVFARREKLHAQRVKSLLDVRLSDETFERPQSFNLGEFWEEWCAERERFLLGYAVTVRVSPGFIHELPRYFGSSVRAKVAQFGSVEADGWTRMDVSFESFEAARDRLLSFGTGVEVVEPYALRRSVLDYAERIVDLYRP